MLVKSSTHNAARIFGVKMIRLHGYVSLEMKFVNFVNFSFFSFFFFFFFFFFFSPPPSSLAIIGGSNIHRPIAFYFHIHTHTPS